MQSVPDSADFPADKSQVDETAERILDAAVNSFLEFGYRRTTLETVAKRLKLSRMTLYRYHADKQALFKAVFFREFQRSAIAIETRLNELTIEENPVIEGFVLAVTLSRRHPLIRRLLDTEPEWLLLNMTLDGENLLAWGKATATAFLHQEKFKEWLVEKDMDLAAELFVRLLLSSILTPGGILTSDDENELRRVARHIVQPLLRAPSQA